MFYSMFHAGPHDYLLIRYPDRLLRTLMITQPLHRNHKTSNMHQQHRTRRHHHRHQHQNHQQESHDDIIQHQSSNTAQTPEKTSINRPCQHRQVFSRGPSRGFSCCQPPKQEKAKPTALLEYWELPEMRA